MQGDALDTGLLTFKAAVAIPRWTVVEFAGSTDTIQPVGTAGNQGFGVALDDVAAGGAVAVLTHGNGIAKIVAGGTVTQGGQVKSTATGTVIDWVTSGAVVGRALTSGVAGTVVPVLTGVI